MPSILTDDPRPEWLRTLEEVGREHLADCPSLVPLDPPELLAAACRATGLSDFGSDDFREPLAVLVESLDRESDLTLLGRIQARSDVLNLLQNRLRITQLVAERPEILEQDIDRPIFIVGLPRSGTSILHELLAEDPRLRAPLTWEARFPCPPATAADADHHPGITSAERLFDFWNQLVPAFRGMHEMGARIPCECVQLTAHTFRCEEFLGRQQTKSYGAWLADADLAPAYRYHRLMLQMFQWALPTERWILKAPSHMGAMPFLLAEYPDARVIQTHRDPLQSMASTASLLSAHAWMRAASVDVGLIKASFAGEGMAARLEAVENARRSPAATRAVFHDVRFSDLMAAPVAVLRGVYERLEMEFGPEREAAILSYLASKPRGKHGRHEYRFEDLGLRIEQERARFLDYQARHGVQSEL